MTAVVSKVLDPGSTFVDVGANFGWFTLVAANRVGPQGRVFAVEANPETYDLLCSNVEINGFADRVTTLRQAAWHETAELDFHVLRKHKGSASLRDEVRQSAIACDDDSQTIRVPARRLDDLIPADTPVHMVKIDAEGAEPYVLRGMQGIMRRNRDLCITVEFAPSWYPDGGAARFLDELEGYGFTIRRIGAGGALAARSHAELLATPHSDLVLIPNHLVV